jgi:hypothetical protein
LQLFGKHEKRLNDNSTAIATNTTNIATNATSLATNTTAIATNTTAINTKLTKGGDAIGATLRMGTNDAQSLTLKTNNVDRLIVDASGNIVQAGSTTNFDLVIPRIRNTVGVFFQFVRNTILGQLDLGGDFTEINFTKPITNYKGTGSRMVEAASDGTPSATEAIVSYWIFNPTVQALLSNSTNWNQANIYTGASLTSYLLEQSQVYTDSLYRYEMISTTAPIRVPLFRVRRRLVQQLTNVSNVGVSIETDLFNYPIPANTLNKNNDSLEGFASGYFGGSVSGELKVYFGASIVINISGVASVGDAYVITYRITRTSVGHQKIWIQYVFGSGYTASTNSVGYAETTLDETTVLTFKVTGKDTTSSKVILSDINIDHVPSI